MVDGREGRERERGGAEGGQAAPGPCEAGRGRGGDGARVVAAVKGQEGREEEGGRVRLLGRGEDKEVAQDPGEAEGKGKEARSCLRSR